MYEKFPELSRSISKAIQSTERGSMTLIELVRATGMKGDVITRVAIQMQQEGTLAWRDEFDGLGRKIVYFLPAEGAASEQE